ncbi:hypothetical protein [Thermomonospora umbrina]|uniref:Uncharacterized protein n=1 Tax=Thermomonospora umbrina TaxID=111806 RepID=A0A3D9SR74_9ACTN|nr:hypothetical protein [Thermomonospora umbrina]REE95134.1 hypothetical protein DFJ69_0515 [Thermomonospora umbrina]
MAADSSQSPSAASGPSGPSGPSGHSEEYAELDRLPTGELHDRAMKLALARGDLGFLWRVLRDIPPAEAAAGQPAQGTADILHVSALINEFLHAGEGDVAEALRPVYLDYLAPSDTSRLSEPPGATGSSGS